MLLFFKYLAEMDIAERRKPQGGATLFQGNKKSYHLRMSTVADFQQRETMVIRFFNQKITKQCFSYFLAHQFKDLFNNSQQKGLYLFSGPVGSGKTSTMYQLARKYQAQEQQIITIEDPVEIRQEHFLQLQVNEKIHATYDNLIKLCLRHRPDILIVGEIRDEKTAQAVLRGALTGHTIFSTIHAQSKYGVCLRLMELGILKTEILQCVKRVIYQRILPIYCELCQGSCLPDCTHRQFSNKKGVLFDYLDLKELASFLADPISRSYDWNLNLRKVWSIGGITKEIFYEEKDNQESVTRSNDGII